MKSCNNLNCMSSNVYITENICRPFMCDSFRKHSKQLVWLWETLNSIGSTCMYVASFRNSTVKLHYLHTTD